MGVDHTYEDIAVKIIKASEISGIPPQKIIKLIWTVVEIQLNRKDEGLTMQEVFREAADIVNVRI